MIDRNLLREGLENLKEAAAAKRADPDWDRIASLDVARRESIARLDPLRSERNALSAEVARKKRAGERADDLVEKNRLLREEVQSLEEKERTLAAELDPLLLTIPNPAAPDVPVGPDESANRTVRTWGEPAAFDFEPKPHWELGEKLGILDLERAGRVSGNSFYFLLGDGARLQRALAQFMLDLQTREHGYVEVAPPLLVQESSLIGTGQLPKLADDMYRLDARDGLYLIPTAEVSVTNLHREETLSEESLPRRYVACTPCFRREAGAAGKSTRGIQRVHQFDKVELVQFTTPETSDEALEGLVGHAEEVLRRLGLAYRVVLLSTGDMSFASRRTYDLEVYAPGTGGRLEVSSCSSFGDFQARRARIRCKPSKGKARFLHTLNGSGLALPRLWIALLETYQQADGSVRVPEALRPYLDGRERIG